MDLSKISTEDLLALKSGDLSKVSTSGLMQLKSMQSEDTIPEPDTHSSGAGAFGRGALESALPSAAGILAGGAGALLGAGAGPVGSVVGGLATGTAASMAVAAAQEAFLKAHPHVADFLGLSEEQRKKDTEAHPYAAMAGQLAPNLLAFRPTTSLVKSLAGASTKAAQEAIVSARVNAAIQGGIGGGLEFGQESIGDEPYDPVKIALAGGLSALGSKETPIGRKLTRAGEDLVIGSDTATRRMIDAIRRPETIPSEPKKYDVTQEIQPDASGEPPAAIGDKPPLTDAHAAALDSLRSVDHDKRYWSVVAKDLGLDKDGAKDLLRELRENGYLSNDSKGRYIINGEETTAASGTRNVPPKTQTKPSGTSADVPVQPDTAGRPGTPETGNAGLATDRGNVSAPNVGEGDGSGSLSLDELGQMFDEYQKTNNDVQRKAKPSPFIEGKKAEKTRFNNALKDLTSQIKPTTTDEEFNTILSSVLDTHMGEATPTDQAFIENLTERGGEYLGKLRKVVSEKPPIKPTVKPVGELEAKLSPEYAAEQRKYFSDNKYEQPDDVGEAGYFSWKHDTPLADGKSKIIGIVEPGQYDNNKVIWLPIESSNPNVGTSTIRVIDNGEGGYVPKMVWEIYSNKLDNRGWKIGVGSFDNQENMDAEIRNKIVGPELYDRITNLNPNNYRTKIDLITDINKILRGHAASAKPIDKHAELIDRIDALISDVHSSRESSLKLLKDQIREADDPKTIAKLEAEVLRQESIPRDERASIPNQSKPTTATENTDNISATIWGHLMGGDFQAAVNHVATPVEGVPRNPIMQALAETLNGATGGKKGSPFKNVKVNVEGQKGYDKETIDRLKKNGKSAMYDAKTNTVHFTTEGMNDATVLHEATHAATVSILKEFERVSSDPMFASKRNLIDKLTAEYRVVNRELDQARRDKLPDTMIGKKLSQTESIGKRLDGLRKEVYGNLDTEEFNGAQRINQLFKDQKVRTALHEAHPEAFRNVYEFVSHALTDSKFQKAMSEVKLAPTIYSEGRAADKPNLWQAFTNAIISFFKLPDASGNALIELSEAMNDILRVPAKGGVEGVGELYYAGNPKIYKAPEHPKFTNPNDWVEYIKDQKMERTEKTLLNMKAPKTFYQKFQNAVIALQSDRRLVKDLDDAMMMAGKGIAGGENQNMVYNALIRSSGIAKDMLATHVDQYTNAINNIVDNYSKAKGMTIHEALAELDMYMMALHEPERREALFMAHAPLDNTTSFNKTYHDANGVPYVHNDTAAGHRAHMENNINSNANLTNIKKILLKDGTTESVADEYRRILKDIVFKKDANGNFAVDPKTGFKISSDNVKSLGDSSIRKVDKDGNKSSGAMATNINDKLYSVIGGYPPEAIQAIRAKYAQEIKNPKVSDLLVNPESGLSAQLTKLQDRTRELAQTANYWTQPVSNRVKFYGFEHYVPFKGKPEEVGSIEAANNQTIDGSRRFGSGYSDSQEAAQGRKSESSNTILQSMADATQAAMQVGRKDVTESIANLIKAYPSMGKKIDTIEFKERETRGKKLAEDRGPNKFFRYMPDGKIEIYELNDPRISAAIRRVYTHNDDIINRGINQVGKITQFIASGHTRLNVAFAPYNFVRDALSNTTAIWAEMGFAKGSQFLSRMTNNVVNGGLKTTYDVARLYEKGDMATIDNMAKKDPFVKDLIEFIRTGGRTSWIQGMADRGQHEKLLRDIKAQGGIAKTKDQIEKIADRYGDIFELTTRASAYSTAKEHYTEQAVKKFTEKNGRAPTDEERIALKESDHVKNLASGFTKELINYENSGTYGKTLGSLFAFWRANATGAVRALDAILPAFMSPASFVKQLPLELQHQAQIDYAIEKFSRVNRREPSAQEMQAILASPEVLHAKEASDKLIARFMEKKKTAQLMMAALFGSGMVAYNMSYMLGGDDTAGRNEVATDDKSQWVRSWRIPVGKDAMGKDNNFIQIPWGYGGGAFAAIGAQLMSTLYGHTNVTDLAGNVTRLVRDSYLPVPSAEFSVFDDPLAWAVDSVLPSAFRPIVELKMNKDTFGRQIHSTNISKYGGVYAGGDNIPQIWQKVTRELSEITNDDVHIEPATLHFFASNWVDGYSRLASMVYDSANGAMGNKDLDAKTALLPFGNFIGKRTSFDARTYADAQKDVESKKESLKQFETRPDLWRKYVDAHPNAPALVEVFDKINGGPLKKIRESIKALESSDRPPSEYADRVRQLKETRDLVMRKYNDYYDANKD